MRELNEYTKQEYSDQPDRVLRLLLKLPSLRSLSPDVMEELFFAGLIGNVQIDSIIPYILKMETGEYNSQMGLGGMMGASQEVEEDCITDGDERFVEIPHTEQLQHSIQDTVHLQNSINNDSAASSVL